MNRMTRLSLIAVMMLSTTALSIIAYHAMYPEPKAEPAHPAEPTYPPMARPRVSRLPRIVEKMIPPPPPPKRTATEIAECVRVKTVEYQNKIHFMLLANAMPAAQADPRIIVNRTVMPASIVTPGDPLTADLVGAMRAAITEACGATPPPSEGPPAQVASEGGHYYPQVTVNGTSVRMVMDTGATTVSLTDADARYAGVDCNPAQKIKTTFDTANGPREGFIFLLPEITVQGITLRNVKASCGNRSDNSLLGMSALDRLSITINNGRMTLAPK